MIDGDDVRANVIIDAFDLNFMFSQQTNPWS